MENMTPRALTVRQVTKLLQLGRPRIYDLIREGKIEAFRVGSVWRVKRSSIEKLVGEIPESFFAPQASDEG